MNLWSLIPDELKTVAVIGMAKNAGKTVVLNRLIAEAAQENRLLGLTSIGRDGELEDLVTGTEKPGILVEPGTLLATTDLCLRRSDARVEILETTREKTPVGQVVLVRVRQRGWVELAGPDTNRGIQRVCRQMLRHGARQVLVDGALNRKTSASPAIADGGILATGAVLSRDLREAVAETAHQVQVLETPLWQPQVPPVSLTQARMAGMEALLPEESGVGLVDADGTIEALPFASALSQGKEIGRLMKPGHQGVLIRGSLTNRTVRDLVDTTPLYRDMPLVLEDATRLFISRQEGRLWQKQGLQFQVLRPIRLLFLTVNPWSPGGWRFRSADFCRQMREAVQTVPVVNVMGREGLA
ncbi:hypothetical protein [Anoxynatronum sibiricum]|uniref:Uncharacterized protein n=1 Tax=Anoxynatronum sibiricum TaxID=210623 RepID=A0ABU9VUS5_9CLOT